jgi:8-oxo-dGTP pyrophosphatase MutT (NUDIX family)
MTGDKQRIAPTPRDLPDWLASRLSGPMPPEAARARFAPTLSYGRHFGPAAFDARDAAVMILLYPRKGDWHVPLTIRPETMAAHAGQISFPGGMVEPGETTRDAALRELHEELGVEQSAVKVLGSLSTTYVFVSNFLVRPWIAASREPLAFKPCAEEVADVIEAPLAHLADLAHVGEHRYERGELTFTAPHFELDGHRVWGATSIILAELIALLAELPAGWHVVANAAGAEPT